MTPAKLLEILRREIDGQKIFRNTERLWKMERGQTSRDHQRAARLTCQLLNQSAHLSPSLLNFPADGKTTYFDRRMPLNWYAKLGRLTVLKSPLSLDDQVVADYERHPFHLVKGSVTTPKGGRVLRLITERQLNAGEDPRDTLVITDATTLPRFPILRRVLDMGALGLVTSYLPAGNATPDALHWINALTEGNHWHVQADDRPFLAYSVSPRAGEQLRLAASRGEVVARAECDGRREAGQFPVVTAILPGRRREELWLFSHLFEPLASDNSNGVAASIAMADTIGRLSQSGVLPPLEYSLRLVFSYEMYGLAAYASSVGPSGRRRVLGILNTDGSYLPPEGSVQITLSAPAAPFFASHLLEGVAEGARALGFCRVDSTVETGSYLDDLFLNDRTIGLPTLWAYSNCGLWHNSNQTMARLTPEGLGRLAAFKAAIAASICCPEKEDHTEILQAALDRARGRLDEEAGLAVGQSHAGIGRLSHRLQRELDRVEDFKRWGVASRSVDDILSKLKRHASSLRRSTPPGPNAKPTPWLEYAASIVPARRTAGLPFDLVRVPKGQRIPLSQGMPFGLSHRVLANMDGQKNLRDLALEAGWELNAEPTDANIRTLVSRIAYLTKHGYLKTSFRKALTRQDFVRTLKRVGVRPGGVLLVHSSLSAFGYTQGGAQTVIDALREAIGPKGTLLLPCFTRPYVYFDGRLIKSDDYRPHDPLDLSLIVTGELPRTLLKQRGALRSEHATHSFAAWGPAAKGLIANHRENEPPCGETSPLASLLTHQGQILHLGCGLGLSTFLHFLEDAMRVSYLSKAVCRVRDGKGLRTVVIDRHLPGHRDFYSPAATECRFFRAVRQAGLKINEAPMGLASMQCLEAGSLFELGTAALRREPGILLCLQPECPFCAAHHRRGVVCQTKPSMPGRRH